MLIRLNNEAKIVEIWLMNAERDDPALRRGLQPLFKAYRSYGYMPVEYMSSENEQTQQGFYRLINECVQQLDDCAEQRTKKGDLRVLHHR